jgi:hypothetical protein
MTWTIVQHSGFGYAGKPGFAQGVEVRRITTKKEENDVKAAGGIMFDTYKEAVDFEMKASYPDDHPGLYPQAKGTFSDRMVDGLKIYIPVREAKG